jgi:hypothetical protein
VIGGVYVLHVLCGWSVVVVAVVCVRLGLLFTHYTSFPALCVEV